MIGSLVGSSRPPASAMRSRRSRRARRGSLLVLVLLGAAAGCGARAAPATSPAVADARTAVRVRTALVNDAVLGPLSIDVLVRDGLVTLRGTVRLPEEVDLALAVVRDVDGVARVESELGIGEASSPPAALPPDPAGAGQIGEPARRPALAPRPDGGPARVIGLGAAARLTRPSETGLGAALSGGPLLRLRPRNGLGPTIAFNWMNAEVESGPAGRPGLAALELRPVMAGAEYGIARGRFAAGASIVAGYSFNGLGIDTERVGAGRAIAVRNSLVWRPGVGAWWDLSPRIGIQAFYGYLFTRPAVTFASDTEIATERLRVDAAVLSVGVAYWVF